MAKKKVFYRLFDTDDGCISLLYNNYEFDFWKEDVYHVY